MRKFRRGWMLLALTVVLVLGGCGCMGLFQKKMESAVQVALNYMAQRYGQEFVYAGPFGGGYNGSAPKTFLVQTADGENIRQILVEVQQVGDQYQVRDNYLAIKYEPQTQAALQQIADSVFGTTTVYYTAATAVLSRQLPANATFEQYLSATGSDIIATIVVPESQYRQELLDLLEDALSSAGFQGLFRLAVLSQTQYDSSTEESVRTIVGTETYSHYTVLSVKSNPTQPLAEE